MQLNKTLNGQQFEDEKQQQFYQLTIYGKYESSFAYLGDTQFKGQCIQLSQIVLEPHTDFYSIVFYQEQINLNLKSPLNQNRKSMVRKIIEIENKNIKTVRLPKIENLKAIVVEIKNQIQTMIARLPNELQTTKTSLYNKKGELIGFVSYRMKEVNGDAEMQQGEYSQFSQDLQSDSQFLHNVKEQQKGAVKQTKQQENVVKQNQGMVQSANHNHSLNSENQFLPKETQGQLAYSNENQQSNRELADKKDIKKEDEQQNSKLQKHVVPKMILSALVKQSKQQNLVQPIKQQSKPETIKIESPKEQKQVREENKLIAKLRQIQNKTMAQKQKMKENQRIKQTHRFKIRTNQSSEQKKSEKDINSDQEHDSQKAKGSMVYKIPVELQSIQADPTKSKFANQTAEKRRISLNFPIDFGGRSFLQKHLKQFTPKNAQTKNTNNNNIDQSFTSGKGNLEDQKKIFRKPGFITTHKKGNEIRQHMREFTSLKKRQERPTQTQLKKVDFLQMKRVQSQEKQIPLSKSNQKLKLAMSKNIVDIKVSQSIKPKKLIKVLNQSYLPKIPEKKEFVQKQIPNPIVDPQFSKKQEKQKSPPHSSSQKQKTTLTKHHKLENQKLNSQYSIPIKSNQHSFDIIVSNLSVNLYNKAFGKKFVELSSGRQMYTTDTLHGSHLLWVNRGYLFRGVLSSDCLYISLKSQVDNYLKILGKAKINVNELLLNYKQSFYQCYLCSPSDELIAVIIVGYEIFNHFANQNTSRELSQNMPVTMTPKKTKKLFKGDTKNIAKLPVIVPEEVSRTSQQRHNSQFKKYRGGHNIRMGRASRFNTEYTDDEPGPGYYNVISDFDRHSVNRKQK